MRYSGEMDCEGCRFWSQMVAESRGGAVVAICLSSGAMKGTYTTGQQRCDDFARNTHGSVDEPPDYGEAARAAYAEQAAARHANGAPMFSHDGTLLDDKGNRSIFDDVDL